MWNNMNDSSKYIYQQIAEKESESYEKQKNEFKAYGKYFDDYGNSVRVKKKREESVYDNKKNKKSKLEQKK